MRFGTHLLLVPLGLSLLGSCASTTTLNLYGGERAYKDGDIEEVDKPPYMAVEALWGVLPWGLGLEVGLSRSDDDGSIGKSDVELTAIEGYVGARKTFREEHALRPYVGGGLSFTDAEVNLDDPNLKLDESDFTEGAYLRAGVGYHFGIFDVGVDYRYTTLGEFDFGDEKYDSDSGILSLFAGLSF